MSAAITCSKIAGQSSLSQPCSVMSGHTPVAMSRSTARIRSTVTPLRRMISIEISARPSVLDTSGERLRVQLMKKARRSLKSVVFSSHSCACFSVSSVMAALLPRRPARVLAILFNQTVDNRRPSVVRCIQPIG